MVEIQGVEHLEFPLSDDAGEPVFNGCEMWLQETVNSILFRNWNRIDKFLHAIQETWPRRLESHSQDQLVTAVTSGTAVHSTTSKPTDGQPPQLMALQTELDQWPALRVLSACAGRIGIWASNGVDTDELVHSSHDLLMDDALFAETVGTLPGQTLWLRLEPFSFQVECKDFFAARTLMDAAGTLFKKPGVFISSCHSESCVLELCGAECLELPLVTPDRTRRFMGREDWVRKLVNDDLQRSWDKIERLLAAIKATPTDVAAEAWGRAPSCVDEVIFGSYKARNVRMGHS